MFDSIFKQLGESLVNGGGPEDPVMRLTGLWDLVFTGIRFKFQGHKLQLVSDPLEASCDSLNCSNRE